MTDYRDMPALESLNYRLRKDGQYERIHTPMPRYPGPDYGADPLGDGTFRMVPSGDIVGLEESRRRLTPVK